MTTLTPAALKGETCTGTATCKRPANWQVAENYGRLYTTESRSSSYGAHYCKAHAQTALEDQEAMMSSDERMVLYKNNKRRYGALGTLQEAIGKLRSIQATEYWKMQLAADHWSGDRLTVGVDEEMSAYVLGELAKLGIGEMLANLEAIDQAARERFIFRAPR